MNRTFVVAFLVLGLIGSAIYMYFTFPRTREEIPGSNNQIPFPSAPGPNNMPVPDAVPHPNTPPAPHGPTLRVMAWGAGEEAHRLTAQVDAYSARTGHAVSLTIDPTEADYRRDLAQAMTVGPAPDVCLVDARDFSGLDPARDLAAVSPEDIRAPRSIAAFTVGGEVKAFPAEFSVELLYFNRNQFDRAGIGYPGRHWTWDILEAMARALAACRLTTDAGQPIYPLELPTDFDFWNLLCTEAGHPALDLNVWHVEDAAGRDSQVRALTLLHEIFHDLAVTAPLPRSTEPPGHWFAEEQASLLIAPSDERAALGALPYGVTLMPSDIERATLARVNGWGVLANSPRIEDARALAAGLAREPMHAGWSATHGDPADADEALCREALEMAVLPRLEARTAPFADELDREIGTLARNGNEAPDAVYAQIQTEYRTEYRLTDAAGGASSPAPIIAPRAQVPTLRGL